MKIYVCDLHKKEGTLKESTRYSNIKGAAMYRIDYCDDHAKDMPKTAAGLVRLRFSLDGIERKESDKEIEETFLRRL